MDNVRLSGLLRCKNLEEADVVTSYLPEHVELTRNEPGCISFEVSPTQDPLVWSVEERFTDPEAFRAHQERAASSPWGRMTSAIARDYTISGLD